MTTTLITSPTTKDRQADQLRREVTRIQRLALEAVGELDVSSGIAHCRTLRSLLWRAGNLGLDVTQRAMEKEGP
jgi:hypothetical protein